VVPVHVLKLMVPDVVEGVKPRSNRNRICGPEYTETPEHVPLVQYVTVPEVEPV
jgi:hypothetical protein